LSIPFNKMRNVTARGSRLELSGPPGVVTIHLGVAAAKWADKILRPPSRLQKLGVRPDWRASVLGVDDEDFLKELEDAVAFVSIGRAAQNSDAIFYGALKAEQLSKLAMLKAALKPAGAIWVVRPKGRPEISESAVMAAGKAAGLVDVKVVRFSPTHTAEKFVIPVKDRDSWIHRSGSRTKPERSFRRP
jgi:hypothetical protein